MKKLVWVKMKWEHCALEKIVALSNSLLTKSLKTIKLQLPSVKKWSKIFDEILYIKYNPENVKEFTGEGNYNFEVKVRC